MTKDFYQSPPMQDAWIFKKSSKGNINVLAPNVLQDKMKCCELQMIMC
jgi:hypothetical protein